MRSRRAQALCMFAVLATAAAAFALRARSVGTRQAWDVFNVQVMNEEFCDLHHVASTIACSKLEPKQSLYDCKRGAPYNYPRIVAYSLRALGLDEPSAGSFGWCVVGMGVFCLVCVVWHCRGRLGLLSSLLLIAPPVTFGLCRANTDVIVFCGIAITCILAERWKRASEWLLAVGALAVAMYKLFPIAGSICVVGRRGKTGVVLLLAVTLLFGAYLFLERDTLPQIWHNTPRGMVGRAYGLNVFPDNSALLLLRFLRSKGHSLEDLRSSHSRPIPSKDLARLTYVARVAWYSLLVALTVVIARSTPRVASWAGNDAWLAAYLFGACVFVATWALTRSYDYRLIFLSLTYPRMTMEAKATDRRTWRITIWAGLIAMFLSGLQVIEGSGIDELPLAWVWCFHLVNLCTWCVHRSFNAGASRPRMLGRPCECG